MGRKEERESRGLERGKRRRGRTGWNKMLKHLLL